MTTPPGSPPAVLGDIITIISCTLLKAQGAEVRALLRLPQSPLPGRGAGAVGAWDRLPCCGCPSRAPPSRPRARCPQGWAWVNLLRGAEAVPALGTPALRGASGALVWFQAASHEPLCPPKGSCSCKDAGLGTVTAAAQQSSVWPARSQVMRCSLDRSARGVGGRRLPRAPVSRNLSPAGTAVWREGKARASPSQRRCVAPQLAGGHSWPGWETRQASRAGLSAEAGS